MKKFFTLVLVIALSTALLVPTSLAWESHTVDMDNVGVDVGASKWAMEELKAAAEAELVPVLTGNPGFQDAITREQFAELALNMTSVICGEGPDILLAKTFTDCDNIQVRLASAAGIVDGVGGGRFDPTATSNREQIASMLYRAIDYMEKNMENTILSVPADISAFSDKGQVSSWAAEGLGALAANGIMKGSGTTVLPQNPCTVEQSILLCYRIYTMMIAQQQ